MYHRAENARLRIFVRTCNETSPKTWTIVSKLIFQPNDAPSLRRLNLPRTLTTCTRSVRPFCLFQLGKKHLT
ncbi:hypothetical protein Y032_0020g92 [Ancylostoma ceylanicum]|uniref:Uncharacterized protein n=1 Tax=Ancylostoma ceylanicum TaxID=53326 RepID=A0A016V1Z9_9BILA|nr:hypothetical protein Y032_0020g92 [Ancylostoma ceylanicum]